MSHSSKKVSFGEACFPPLKWKPPPPLPTRCQRGARGPSYELVGAVSGGASGSSRPAPSATRAADGVGAARRETPRARSEASREGRGGDPPRGRRLPGRRRGAAPSSAEDGRPRRWRRGVYFSVPGRRRRIPGLMCAPRGRRGSPLALWLGPEEEHNARGPAGATRIRPAEVKRRCPHAIFLVACADLRFDRPRGGRAAATASFQRGWAAVAAACGEWGRAASPGERAGGGRLNLERAGPSGAAAAALSRKAEGGRRGPLPEKDVCCSGRATATDVTSGAVRDTPRPRRSQA